MVLGMGFEPTHLTAYASETYVSTNSTTRARTPRSIGRALEKSSIPYKKRAFEALFQIIMVGREGFEPPKSKTKDLQSSPFDRSGTDPKQNFECISENTISDVSDFLEFQVPNIVWSHLSDLNWWPPVYKTDALPTELRWLVGLIV